MALVFACGETSGVKRTPVGGGGGYESTTGGRFNSDVARCSLIATDDGGADSFEAFLDSTEAEIRCVFYWYFDGFGNQSGGDRVAWGFYDTNGDGIFRLIRNTSSTTGAWQYWNGSSWTQIGSDFSTTGIDDTLIRVEVALVTGASGTVEVLIGNDPTALDIHLEETSIGTATLAVDSFFMSTPNSGALGNTDCYYSEILMVDDASQSLDGWRFETEAPTGAGTDSDGTGDYTDIDEAVNDDATTVLTLAAGGDKNGFTSPARTRTMTRPDFKGVGVSAEMSREASGPQSARFYLLIDSTYYYGDTFALTESLEPYNHIWELNPDTGVAWTQADAESASLEWGIEAVT